MIWRTDNVLFCCSRYSKVMTIEEWSYVQKTVRTVWSNIMVINSIVKIKWSLISDSIDGQ